MEQITVAYTASRKKERKCFASLLQTASTWIGKGPKGQDVSIRILRLFEHGNLTEVSPEIKNLSIHAIMHKRTDDMALCVSDGNHQAIQRMNAFEDAIRSKLHLICGKPQSFIMLDPLECVWRLIDRRQIYQAIDNSFGSPNTAAHPNRSCSSPNPPRPPILSAIKSLPWVDVPLDRGTEAIRNAVEGRLTFPVILKRRVACGTQSSHEMAVARDIDGLIAAAKDIFALLEPTSGSDSDETAPDPAHVGTYRYHALAQEFRSHTDGLIFKGYIIGSRLDIQPRRGIDVKDISLKKGSYFRFNSQTKCTATIPGFHPLTGCSKTTEAVQPSLDLCKAAVAAMTKEIGLSLMGFDIVYDIRSKTYHIVDINFFPSYKGWTKAVTNDYLLQHICDCVLGTS